MFVRPRYIPDVDATVIKPVRLDLLTIIFYHFPSKKVSVVSLTKRSLFATCGTSCVTSLPVFCKGDLMK